MDNPTMAKSLKPHASFERLLRAAAAHERVTEEDVTDTALAEWLEETPQTVFNWKKRGVSLPGARKAEKAFGCTVTHILDGTPMFPPVPDYSVAEAMIVLAKHLHSPSTLLTEAAEKSLAQVAKHPDDVEKVREAAAVLEATIAAVRSSGKGQHSDREIFPATAQS